MENPCDVTPPVASNGGNKQTGGSQAWNSRRADAQPSPSPPKSWS